MPLPPVYQQQPCDRHQDLPGFFAGATRLERGHWEFSDGRSRLWQTTSSMPVLPSQCSTC
jgi:hypothetical protein